MADSPLEIVGDSQLGSPDAYELVHDRDILEIRARYDSSDAYLAAARFLANQDMHLYGELVLQFPAIRHFGTLAINNVESNEDIASFRTGRSPGREVVRITDDPTIIVDGTYDTPPIRDATLELGSLRTWSITSESSSGDLTLTHESLAASTVRIGGSSSYDSSLKLVSARSWSIKSAITNSLVISHPTTGTDSTVKIDGYSTNYANTTLQLASADTWSISSKWNDNLEFSSAGGSGTIVFYPVGRIQCDDNIEVGGNVEAAADITTTGGDIYSTGGHIVIKSGSGAPTGGDVGALYLDTTNERLYVKLSGSWYYASLTSS